MRSWRRCSEDGTSMRKALSILVGIPLWSLFATPAPGQTPLADRPGCIALNATSQPTITYAAKRQFSATKTLNVVFTATFVPAQESDMPKSAVLTITTPRGHVYQKVDFPIGKLGEEGEGEETRVLPGYHHPVPVVHPKADVRSLTKPQGVVLSLPPLLVGGTSIQNGGLYGKWKAEFRADDVSQPCSVDFRISP